MGFVWWIIKDVICMPHGQNTRFRFKLAYGLMGGVLFATYHPANFIYGVIAGYMFGALRLNYQTPKLPRGFELKMKNVDEQQRELLLREDEEYQLSMRNVIHLKPNLYPL